MFAVKSGANIPLCELATLCLFKVPSSSSFFVFLFAVWLLFFNISSPLSLPYPLPISSCFCFCSSVRLPMDQGSARYCIILFVCLFLHHYLTSFAGLFVSSSSSYLMLFVCLLACSFCVSSSSSLCPAAFVLALLMDWGSAHYSIKLINNHPCPDIA